LKIKKLSKRLIFGVWETPPSISRLSLYGKKISTPNAYIVIVIRIHGAKVMVFLSFAKNKFPKFLSLSNTVTPSAPGIFHTKYGSKEAFTQKINQK